MRGVRIILYQRVHLVKFLILVTGVAMLGLRLMILKMLIGVMSWLGLRVRLPAMGGEFIKVDEFIVK